MGIENDNFAHNKLAEYEHWSVYLHEDQTYLGRNYIALHRDGEIDPFEGVTPIEQIELLVVVGGVKHALSKLYQPDLLNYANFRNTWPHCHWHVIPRYQTPRVVAGHTFTDENWGKNYAPYPKLDLASEVYEQIKSDLSTELKGN